MGAGSFYYLEVETTINSYTFSRIFVDVTALHHISMDVF